MTRRFVFHRRALLGLAAGAGASLLARTASAEDAPERIELWPGQPPGGPAPDVGETMSFRGRLKGVTRPRLLLHRPAKPNGTAIVVMSGGGYLFLASGQEGQPACHWLASQGVLAAELIYRLPGDGWAPEAPFQDAQRALRLLRARAVAWGLAHLGVLGFSAGGHLAGMTAVRPQAALYPAVDAAGALSARPDFAGLIYPVINMLPPLDHTRSRRVLLGAHPDAAAARALSVDEQVTPQAPPTFLAQASDDPIAPIANSFLMDAALRRAGVPVEMHVFSSGGHGWGMGRPGSEVAAWPELFAAWLVGSGFAPRTPQPM